MIKYLLVAFLTMTLFLSPLLYTLAMGGTSLDSIFIYGPILHGIDLFIGFFVGFLN